MGTTGTYLFIPFILLVIGFFVFLFYQVTTSDTETARKQGKQARTERTDHRDEQVPKTQSSPEQSGEL